MNIPRTTSALFALLAFTVILFSGCSPDVSVDVEPDEIYAEYELFYNANEGKSYAFTTFKAGNLLGQRIELENNAQVSFNGDVLTWNPDFFRYEKEYNGNINTGDFLYVDELGNSFENTATLTSIDRPSDLDSIFLLQAYELEWVGSELGATEDVTVNLNGVVEGDLQTFYTNDEGARSILLGRDQLFQLGEGPGTLWMDRRTYGTYSGNAVGGYVVARFRGINATPTLY